MLHVLESLKLDNWPKRRRVIYYALAFCAFNISWIVANGADAFSVQIALALITAAVTIILGYVFGAIKDDEKKREIELRASEYEVGHGFDPALPPLSDEGER